MTRAALVSVFAALFVFLAFSVVSPGDAMAQDKDDKGDAPAADSGKVKNYDFSGDEIDGDLVKPDGDFIETRKFADHGNLIRIRQHFIREIIKSAEDL